MSGKKYFECAICGKKYEACYSCGRKDPSLSWKNLCDTAEHYKIFQIVSGYTAGVYTKEEAAKKLKNVNLSDLNSLRDNIRSIIKSIQSEPKQPKVHKVVETKTDDTKVADDAKTEDAPVADAPVAAEAKSVN